MFVFWWIRKKETKKYDTKVCMEDEEKCSNSWWWFFSEKMRLFVQKKKHNCFLNDCNVSVSAGGRYQPLGVWPLINEQCHAHFRDLCPAHNKMSVPPTYLPPKRISLNFCGLKKKLWKCLLHGKQSNNSEEKNNAPKFEMHLWGFFCKPSTHLYLY